MRNKRVIVVGFVFLFAVVASIALRVVWPEFVAPQRQYELSNLAQDIQLGQRKDELRSFLNTRLEDSLQRYSEVDDRMILVENPLRIGASNWVLVLAFRDMILVGKGFRSADSLQEHPDGAPSDMVDETFAADWSTTYQDY